MTVAERVGDGWNKFLLSIRDKKAFEVTAAGATGFDHLKGSKHCLLVTFRRNGEPVPTPVWFGLDSGKVYARSEERVGKVKRIRANPRVLVAPATTAASRRGPRPRGRPGSCPRPRRRRPSARSRRTSGSAARCTRASR